MWRNQFTADILAWERAELSLRTSLPCLAAIALPLAAGIWMDQPRFGMVAASGAMSVGFGAFHRLGRSNLAPMLLASVGMCMSTLVGSLAGRGGAAAVVEGGVGGFGYGMLGVFGPAVSWTALQWVIFLVIAGAYPVDTDQALLRAGLTLGGGLLQTLLVVALSYLGAALRPRVDAAVLPPGADRDQAAPLLPWKPTGSDLQLAWRLAVTLAVTTAIYRWSQWPNGYWIPMTVAIVLKGDFHQTAARGLGRLVGTLLGAGLATLLAAELRPAPVATAALIVVFAWLCYALLRVNYTLYAACITSYIVFLFAFIGLPERQVVAHRLICTAAGGACAMLAYLRPFPRRRK